MRKHLLAAGIAAAALIPSALFAQETCEQHSSHRTVGTLAGAGIGAVIGGVVAGHDDRTTGAVVGGIAGAIAGNQIAKPKNDCDRAYGYYDDRGAWHANAVPAAQAAGYYDRSGNWVNGTPNGYYDSQGRWTTAQAASQAAGYYDRNGRFVPASASGYYDTDGRWVAGSHSGHYDVNGRWVAGPAIGRYDANGRWIPGQAAGHRDANGVWVADAQPGYYENGRWRRGEAHGFYDAQGRWHATAPFAGERASNTNASYGQSDWSQAPPGFRARESWLRATIQRGMEQGRLSQEEGAQALRELTQLRREERGLRHYQGGQLGRRDAYRMQARLDEIRADLTWSRRGGNRTY